MLRISDPISQRKQQSTDKNILIAEYTRQTEEFEGRLDKTPVDICSYLSPSHKYRFHPDDRVTIDDFMEDPDTILVGKVFLCRIITPCIKILSLITVVEVPDEHLKEQAVILSLHNYQHPSDQEQEMSIPIFSTGTILAVGNPMFFHPAADKMYSVRCDNPGDVFVLSQREFEHCFPGLKWPSGESSIENSQLKTDELTIKEWKSSGNRWMKKKNYAAALPYYTAAIEQNHEDLEALILRSSMYLNLSLYQKALKDATEILFKNPLCKEGIFLKASSLIGLSQYEKAIELLGGHIKKGISSLDDVENGRLKKLLVKAKTQMNEQRHGDYDLIKMLHCGIGHYHDCADYIGNVVEEKIPGKGRGMIATKDMVCGDLIIATKACAMVVCEDEDENDEWPVDTIETGNRLDAGTQLRISIAHRMMQDPDVTKAVYNMYDGTERLDINSYQLENKYIHMGRINAICNLNSFTQSSPTCFNDGEEHLEVIGLWPIASLFNHGCYDSNSTWKILGNVIFVRASRDIKKGEEVTTLYVSYLNEYQNRVSALSTYLIVCKCTLCSMDSRESHAFHNRRKEIRQEIRTLVEVKENRYSKIKQLIEELRKLRPNNLELNVDRIWPMISLAKKYKYKKEYCNATEILRNALKFTCKTGLIDVTTRCGLDGLICSFMCKDFESVKVFACALKECSIQEYGTYSEDLAKLIFPDKHSKILLRIHALMK